MSNKSVSEKELNTKKIISENLQALMSEHGLNNVQLSEVLGVSESTVGKWLLLKSTPRIGVIEKLASYFNVNKSDLIERRSQKNIVSILHRSEDFEVTSSTRRLLPNREEELTKALYDTTAPLVSDAFRESEAEYALPGSTVPYEMDEDGKPTREYMIEAIDKSELRYAAESGKTHHDLDRDRLLAFYLAVKEAFFEK